MNKQLVYAENKTLFLNTSLSMSAFTKTGLANHLDEKGWLAEKSDGEWKFSPWSFTGTRQLECTDENLSMAARAAKETILLEGKAFSGKTLKALFDLSESKELGETEISFVVYAAAKTCSALESASRQKIDIYNIGAGGIFISADYQKIIFLPRTLFETSIHCAGTKAAAEYNGIYINPALKNYAAINYTQSVIAYRMLTKSFPFNEIDLAKRNWDILDHNYEPLRNRIWALDEKLSFFVDNALQRKSQIMYHGKKNGENKQSFSEKVSSTLNEDYDSSSRIKQEVLLNFPLEELYKETGLTNKGEIPEGGQISPVIKKSTISPDKFEKNAIKESIRFKIRLSRKRWIRNHKTVLAISSCVLLAVIITVSSYFGGIQKNTISKGLTSFDTVQMFYSGFNRLDVTAIQGSSQGNGGKEFTELISNVFVASRAKSAYNTQESTVSPAEWFCFNFDCHYSIFGLSNLKIDNINGNPFFKGPTRKSKPKAISEEYGTPVTPDSTRDYVAKYYLVYNEDDTLLIIEQMDIVHLLFHGNRWVITGIATKEISSQEISFTDFIEAFKAEWEKSNQNPKITANKLRSKYEWIPTDTEIDAGQISTDFARNPYAFEED